MKSKIDHIRACNTGDNVVTMIHYVVVYKSGRTRYCLDCDMPKTVKDFLRHNATKQNKIDILHKWCSDVYIWRKEA